MAPVPGATSQHASSLIRRAIAPLHSLVKRKIEGDPAQYHPGYGVKPPDSFNNKGYFALFAILGAAMVVASIWFFFWAKNGGFHWRKDDWSDYKSTVLRRKDKNGRTLTNATPPTNLGEKSIAGTWDIERDDREDMIETNDFANKRRGNNAKRSRPHPNHREPSDEDLRAYRKERPAKVGGMNRQEDGSQFDYSNASRSDVSEHSTKPLRPRNAPPMTQEAPKKGFLEKKREKAAEKKAEKEAKKKQKEQAKAPKRPRHTFAADETSTIAESDMAENYRRAYRPPAPPHAPSRRNEQRQSSRQHATRASAHHSRQHSPTKPSPLGPQARYPGSFDAYSDAGTSDTGTKVYSHHIPGVSRASPSQSPGFRRGAARRGSLSDSDDDMGLGEMHGFRRR